MGVGSCVAGAVDAWESLSMVVSVMLVSLFARVFASTGCYRVRHST